jgi:endonuclease G, mitochondrial
MLGPDSEESIMIAHRNKRPSHHQVSQQHIQRMQVRTPVGGVGIGENYYDEVGDAADRDEFYRPVQDTFEHGSGEELYRDLNKLLSQSHRPLGYGEARRHLYGQVDKRPDGNLYYLYSGEGPKNESEVKDPTQQNLGNYNCEHVVPQSWFSKQSTPKADLHHLFTEQIQCNGSRGNYPLEETVGGESIPQCGIVQHDGEKSFEPNAGKGEVARATMYFVTRYPGKVGDTRNETQLEDFQQLLKWHKEYPVTDFERHRNDTIEDVQGNRNPFIDFPELAEKVDFSQGFGRSRMRMQAS